MPSRLISALRPLLVAAALAPAASQAHFFAESHNCKAPVKPLEFVTDLDKQEFDAKVAEYRGCLEGFVNKQNEAMEKHRQGAEKAAADWKRYAETVLGATITPAGGEEAAPAAQPGQPAKP